MNKYSPVFLLFLISVLFITVQTTLFSPLKVGYVLPDLNLILIILLAVYSEIRGGAFFAVGNAYMMDVLSGNLFGTFTISRLVTYLLISISFNRIYVKGSLLQVGITISIATIFSWTLTLSILKITEGISFEVPLAEMASRSIVNALVGVQFFWVMSKMVCKISEVDL